MTQNRQGLTQDCDKDVGCGRGVRPLHWDWGTAHSIENFFLGILSKNAGFYAPLLQKATCGKIPGEAA